VVQDNFVSTLSKAKPMAEFKERYTVDSDAELLGAGITGAVQKVTRKHASGQASFAVKSVNLAKYNSNQRRELMNEIAHLRELDHPNVVRLLHTYVGGSSRGWGGGNVYLVLSMCAGGPLSERLPRGEHRIRDVLRQICSAVRYW
jgi:serine/threonine protein kinase